MPTLLTRLGIDGVGFQRGLDNALKQAKAFGQSLNTSLKTQIGQAFTVGAITAFARSIFDTASKIKDLAERLDLSTDTVQRLEIAGRVSGVGMEKLEGAITKMFEGLQSGSKDSMAALEALGISAEDLQGKSFQQAFDIITSQLLGVTSSAQQAEIAFNLFGSRGGLKALQVLREMQNMKTPPMFSAQTIADVDKMGDNLTTAFRAMQIGAAWVGSRVMDAGAMPVAAFRSLATGEKVGDIWDAYRGNKPADPDMIPDRFKPGGLNFPGAGESEETASARSRWMNLQDEINKAEDEGAKQFEANRVAQLTTEERRNELLAERLELVEKINTLGGDANRLERAEAMLGLAGIDREIIGLKDPKDPKAKAEAKFNFQSPNELASIGGRASIGGGGITSPVLAELKKIHDALSRNGIVLRKF